MHVKFHHQQGRILLKGNVDHALQKFSPSISIMCVNKKHGSALVGERSSLDVWNQRLGHPTIPIVNHVVSSFSLPISNSSSSKVSHSCQMGKSYCPFKIPHMYLKVLWI
ncbi:hypothetical protein LIER_37230 [Lithospermum erythrorhizon]|uniref:GAG-pre-integrase domain-containing protein n=1 Tax=Lithospermum erythrorhizon TaxID=34254 RepID=A0AAV3PHF8_LITER